MRQSISHITRSCLLYLILVLGFPASSYAYLSITTEDAQLIPDEILYFYDKSGQLTIDQIAEQQFEAIPNPFCLGYRSGPAWFKFNIRNQSKETDFVLYFNEPFWSEFDFHIRIGNHWAVKSAGLYTPLHSREIRSPSPAFNINIPTNEEITVYLRGTSVSSHIGEFKIMSQDTFFQPGRIKLLDAYNIYSGILFFIMLLTGLLFLVVQDKIYLFYSTYVLSFIVWMSTQSGSYLFLELPGWPDALHAIGSLVVLTLAIFSRELLQVAQHSDILNRLFKISITVIFLCFVGITLQVPHINLFFNLFSSAFFMLLLFTSIKAWKEHYFSTARLYLIALIIYMPTMALMTMTYNGLIGNTGITRYAFAGGSFLEILFFSFILAHRFLDAKNRQLLEQKKLLEEIDSREKLLTEEVKVRTLELQYTHEQLLKQAKQLEEAKSKLAGKASEGSSESSSDDSEKL